jgi:hypothetical protein
MLALFGLALPLWFIGTVFSDRKKKNWNWINKDSRSMYVDAMKTVASSSAIAASLVSAVMSTSSGQRPGGVVLAAKWAVVYLVASIVASVCTVFALSRGYDRARSKLPETEEFKRAMAAGVEIDWAQGKLTEFELACILFFAYIALSGFLVGFILLARMIFLA